jgi:uracil-DNA glycosylase
MPSVLNDLLVEVRRCRHCALHLPLGPRPVLQAGRGARILIVGQAPGSKVHESGIPWRDQSGERLREWMDITEEAFYDPTRVALMPMGFCYPGASNGADLPPRPECAPLWHGRLIAAMPKLQLTLLVGIHAQAYYLRDRKKPTMTDTVKAFAAFRPTLLPLPHPSWRSTGWMSRNPWFEKKVLPELRKAVRRILE